MVLLLLSVLWWRVLADVLNYTVSGAAEQNNITNHIIIQNILFCVSTWSILKDVDDVKFVINFDFPNNTEDYVHRIGRTGRSTNKGTSYTFFTPANSSKAPDLITVLQDANQVELTTFKFLRLHVN